MDMNGLKMKKGFIAIVAIILLVIFAFLESQEVITVIKSAKDIGKNAIEYEELSDTDISTQSDNVQFSAFFTKKQNDPYAGRIKGKTITLGSKEGENLYFELSVSGNGYLEGGQITIDSKNFDWQASIMGDNIVENRYVGNIKKIKLKEQVNAGSQKLFDGTAIAIAPGNDINNYHQVSYVTLTGTYVENGEKTEINVKRELTTDLTGYVSSEIDTKTREYNLTTTGEEMIISFSVKTEETSKSKLILKDYILNVFPPELNKQKASNVIIDGLDAQYHEKAGEQKEYYSCMKSSILNEENKVTKVIPRTNTHTVELVYPIEAYKGESEDNKLFTAIEVPIQAEYIGYSSAEKDTISSKASKVIIAVEPKGIEVVGQDAFNVFVAPRNDKIVSKIKAQEAYNGIETEEDTYEVQWVYYHGNKDTSGKTIMKETVPDSFVSSKKFIGTDSDRYDMTNLISNIGIYFDKANTKNYGSKAKIYVYNDDTDELIKIFDSSEIYKYSQENPFMYETPVKHIRVETEDVAPEALITIYQIKEINDKELVQKISKVDFENINAIYSYLTAHIEESQLNPEYMGYANYEDEKSYLTLDMDDSNLDSSKLENQAIFYINVNKNKYNASGWENGAFLIELPEDIILADITNIDINNENVSIAAYETYQENNKNYIKILTSNTKEEIYRITINTTLYVNPIASSGNKEVHLYGANEACNNYQNNIQDKYDINNNNEINDYVGYDVDYITMEAPNSMITSQMASNYDSKGSAVVAPNTADIDPKDKTVDININLINNYKGRITDTQIFGTIPFEGNTYIRNNNELGSQFTTKMVNNGIKIPNELEGKVTVYYTYNKDATDELSKDNNGWTTNPDDWTKVKKYLIIFENPIVSGKAYQFTYTVEIPEGLEYNKYSYSEHCVNFAYETSDGKITANIEPAKLGIRTSRKYDTEITKLNKENKKVVEGAVYRLTEIDENENEISSKLITSNKNGKLIAKGLYVNAIYKLEEVKNPINYSLNNEKIKFIVREKESNKEQLEIEVLSQDKFSAEPIINTNILIAAIEEEPKYNLTITKKDSATQEAISGVMFYLEPVNKEFTTNNNGQFSMFPLEQGKEYTLKEIYADGYYLMDDITFKLLKENGQFKIQSNNTTFANAQVNVGENEDLINIELELLNDKQPQILINKTNKETGENLQGVQFTIENRTGKVYTTNEEGEVLIKGFAENTQYTIKETKADGFYLQEVTFKIVKDANGQLKVESDNNEFSTATVIDETNKIIKVNLTNEQIPSYSLNITKLSEGTEDQKLKGAVFNLIKEDTGKVKEYTTNDEGIITISGLEAYQTGKNVTGNYTLQEIKSPNGYSNNTEIIKFRVVKEDENYRVEIDNKENLKTLKNVEFNADNLSFVIEDKPLFTLIKTDKDTKETLENVEFVIVELTVPMDYAKDINGNYIGTYDEENNRYVVKTDKNGKITLPLRDGKYYAVEIKALEGYIEKDQIHYFEINTGKAEEPEVPEVTGPVEKEEIEINYIEDLVAIADSVNKDKNTFENTKFKLMRTLDFNENDSYKDATSTKYGDLNGNGTVSNIKTELTTGRGFDGIGFKNPARADNNNIAFMGDFDGQGNEIRNIYIYHTSGYGAKALFASASNCKIENLGVTGKATSTYYNSICAGIVANANNVTINNCYNKAQISSTGYGGVASGIVCTGEAIINNCYNTGKITANTIATGIAGTIYTTISNSYNTAVITSNNGSAFGIGGANVSKCYNTGSVSGKGNVAGISHSATVMDSYNRGNINNGTISSVANYKTAGIAIDGIVINSYNTGNVIGPRYSPAKYSYIYPITGREEMNSYYLSTITLTGLNIERNGIAINADSLKSEEQPSKLNKYVFKKDTENVNAGYPVIKQNIEINKVTTIEKIEDLVELSEQVRNGVNYDGVEVKLANSLDFNDNNSYNDYTNTIYGDLNYDGQTKGIKEELTDQNGKGFTPIGLTEKLPFSGSFNGQGNEIKNIYINTTNVDAGLFGYVLNGKIENVGVSGNITGTNNVGGVVGYYSGQNDIKKCYNNANINGKCAGGIVGYYSAKYKNIIGCYNTGKIEGNNYAGGIIGNKTDYVGVYNCYNIGNVSANINNGYVGAITGNNAIVSKCYYSDNVNIVGKTLNNLGISKDSDYMKTEEFINEISDNYFTKDTENINNEFPIIKFENNEIIDNFIIEKIEDLVKLSQMSNLGELGKDVKIVLNNTIDFNEDSSYRDINDASFGDLNGDGEVKGLKEELTEQTGNGFTPIGIDDKHAFSASFDGQGNEIRNIYIKSNDNRSNLGLFGYAINAKIENLGITGKIIYEGESSNYNYVGGIVANSNNTEITNCYNKAEVQGNICGGITANSNNSRIINCYNEGTIRGIGSSGHIGGIAGYADSLYIEKCYNKGKVEANRGYAGGLVAYLYNNVNSKLEGLYNEGEIICNNEYYAGGLFAYLSNGEKVELNNCYNTGKISGKNYAGGLIAYNYRNIIINNSYNKGDITSSEYVGGLIAYNSLDNNIINSYNEGNVYSNKYAGGLFAFNSAITDIKESYNKGKIIAECDNEFYVGGLVGYQNNKIYANDSYNKGDIIINSKSRGNAGGLMGYESSSAGSYTNCYNEGNIDVNTTNTSYIGGVIGYGSSMVEIKCCYNTGNINSSGRDMYIAGLSGYQGNAVDCYNTGTININSETGYIYCAGLISNYGYIKNAYNTGDINCVGNKNIEIGGIGRKYLYC